jgi:CHAT domain-containing protein
VEAKALIERLAQAATPEEADDILRPHKGTACVSQAFFQEVAGLLGSDPAKAAALAGHWASVKRYGDDPAFAYRAKAGGERAQGLWLQSARSFQQAGRAASNEVDRLSFQRGGVDSFARAGKHTEAVALGRKLARGLDRLGEKALAAQVRLNLANALLWQDRYRSAMRYFQETVPVLGEAGLELDAAGAKLGLSTCHLLGGDLKSAERYGIEARDQYLGLELPHYADLATINVALKHLMTGHADTGLDLLLEVRAREGVSPTDGARVNEFIGDAYIRLNLWQEAVDSFEAAFRVSGDVPLLNRANCHFGIGLALLGMERFDQARAQFRKAKAAYQRSNNAVWTGVASAHLGKAYLAAGALSKALQHIREGESNLSRTTSWFRLAECRLDLAEALIASGEAPGQALTSAARLIHKHALAAHAWRPHALRAVSAEPSRRLAHYRSMLNRMLEARMLTSSTQSRLNFLSDKAKYVKLYLQELFTNANRRKVQEAMQVVLQTRSVALLEEILATADIDPAAGQELERLREELNALTSAETPSGGSRLQTVQTGRVASLQRRWIEATRSVRAAAELSLGSVDPSSIVLIEAGDNLYALSNDKVKQLPISVPELQRQLAWLEFDLLSPAVGGVVSVDIEKALARLAATLVQPWYEGQQNVLLSPDGVLWRVPWQACLHAVNPEAEPLMALHPSASTSGGAAKLSPLNAQRSTLNAALWLYEGSDLPHAELEAEKFLSFFPDASVCRTLDEARRSLNEGFDLLHVAGHAKLNPENPMFSYLQFSDGRLHAAEIATSGLEAGLVTLSACETARMSLSVQDEPEGLARAFLARGASAVLGSSWALDDEAAARMMEPYYKALASGQTAIEALRSARAVGRAWKSHPYYWASLVLFAGYRASISTRN